MQGKKTGGLHNRDKDRTNRAVIASEQKKGNKAKKEEELKSLPRPIRYIDFQFPYPYTSQYTETRMSSKVRVLNESLFVFIHFTVPQNVFFITLVSRGRTEELTENRSVGIKVDRSEWGVAIDCVSLTVLVMLWGSMDS